MEKPQFNFSAPSEKVPFCLNGSSSASVQVGVNRLSYGLWGGEVEGRGGGEWGGVFCLILCAMKLIQPICRRQRMKQIVMDGCMLND